jgi:hypothetical protein
MNQSCKKSRRIMGEPFVLIHGAWCLDLTSFFDFQRTINNPDGAIFQGGLITHANTRFQA